MIIGGIKMCMVLKMEDLAANALIELIKNKDERKAAFRQLESYGNNIVELLSNNGEDAIMPISEYNINLFLNKYSDFFELRNEESESFIYLKKSKDISDLRRSFRAYLPLEILPVFSDKKSLEPLLG
jgi:hypothetical protein